jgi:3-oxoacyl-[acyl-carrier protein] reductase
MTRAAWPHLRETKGCIVNIAGVGAHEGSADFTIGGSVNVALLNFTKAMADIGIRQGVRVNAVNPGLIETERYNNNVERMMREQSLTRAQAVAARLARHRTTRVGRPEEVGTLVAYLASGKADFIQGALIDIDGGSTRAL